MSATTSESPLRSRAAKWTRRGFFGAGALAGGGLLVGVGIRPGNPIEKLKPIVAPADGEALINTWVKIAKDNSITAIVPHCEMGQGVHSTLAQMLAEELDADWAQIRVMQAPTDGSYVVSTAARFFLAPWSLDAPDWLEPTWDGLFTQIARLADGLVTGGSSSVRTTGQNEMRIAGAAARQMLKQAASQEWGVPIGEIETRQGIVTHLKSARQAPYFKFASSAAKQPLPYLPPLKKVSDFRLVGTSVPRLDIPPKVDGSAQFGIDVMPEGLDLQYAAVRRSPVPGTRSIAMNTEAAQSMAGVLQILNMGDFIAVVADSYWHAQRALDTIDVNYSTSESPIRTTADQFSVISDALDQDRASTVMSEGDTERQYSRAATKLAAEYKVPYLAHAPMEPMNCTAWYRDHQCDVWTGTQVPLRVRSAVASAVGLPKENIYVHDTLLGGSFGRRLSTEYATMAARAAKATGYPIKMIWSREEDISKAMYRPADICRIKGGLDETGKLTSYASIFTQRNEASKASTPSIYQIPNVSIHVSEADLHLPFAQWRSVDYSQHSFFIESFIDEAAARSSIDPLGYRLAMMTGSQRHRNVLEQVSRMSSWGETMSKDRAKGVAIAESFGTIVAEVAEVEVAGSRPRVTKVWACCDAGLVVNPDGFRSQIEGGIVFALTAALYGELELVDGAIRQSNFHDYRMLRMNECPDIEVGIINSGTKPTGGAGEPGVPPAAPAVTNAIFAATGKRIRELPIAKQFD